MKASLTKEERTYTRHYTAYFLTQFIYGLIFSGIGPLIPYLSEKSHQPETSYSFVFTCRAAGVVLGTLACKFLQAKKMLTYHQAIAISSFGTFLTCCSFTYAQQIMIQGISFLFNGFFLGIIQTYVSISIIILSSASNFQKIFAIIFGSFGIGGFVGPFLVYYFQDKTFTVFGIGMVLLTSAYLALQSPEKIKQQNKQNNSRSQEYTSDYSANLLCLLAFLYLGTITNIGGWSSSYAVLNNVDTKERAIVYPSIFWALITTGRFVIALLPCSVQTKFTRATEAALVIQILSILIKQLGFIQFSLYFQSIAIGFVISPLYPFIYSISKEFGYQLKENQVGNILAVGTIGEGMLTMVCGKLMDWVDIDMYFYVVIILIIGIYWCRIQLISVLKSPQYMNGEQKLIQLNDA